MGDENMTPLEIFMSTIYEAEKGDVQELMNLQDNTIYIDDGDDDDYYATIQFMKRCYRDNKLELLKKIIKIDPFLMVSDMVDTSVLTYVFEKASEDMEKAIGILDCVPTKYLKGAFFYNESPFELLRRKPNTELMKYLESRTADSAET